MNCRVLILHAMFKAPILGTKTSVWLVRRDDEKRVLFFTENY